MQRFQAFEEELKASLLKARASFQHAGIKGSEVEATFRTFLSQHLPRRLTVGTGEIIDHQLNRSPQMDVVISNEDQPFRSEQDTPGMMVIEGVAASCEVKTTLTTSNLIDCIEKGHKLKKLRNKHLEGDQIMTNNTDRVRFYNQPPYFAVCFENNVSIDTVGKTLAQTHPVEVTDSIAIPAIDAVFILGEGAWINYGDATGSLRVMWGEEGRERTNSTFAQGWTWLPSNYVLVDLLLWLHASMPKVVRFTPIAAGYLSATITQRQMQQYGWIGTDIQNSMPGQ